MSKSPSWIGKPAWLIMTAALVILSPTLATQPLPADPVVVLDQEISEEYLLGSISYFIDKSDRMKLNEAILRFQSGNHSTIVGDKLTLGFVPNQQVWIRFEVLRHRNSPANWLLEAADTLIRESTVFKATRNPNSTAESSLSVVQVPSIDTPWSNHLYQIELEKMKPSVIYVAYRSKTAMRISPTVYTTERWASVQAYKDLLSGTYLGGMLMIFLLTTFRSVRYRSRVDLFYTAYVGALCVSVFMSLGLDHRLGIPVSSDLTDSLIYIAGIIALIALIGFTRTFISWPRTNRRRVDQALWLLLTFIVLIGSLAWHIDMGLGFLFLNVLTLCVVIALALLSIWGTVNKYLNAQFFLVAFSPFLVTVALRVLEALDVLSFGQQVFQLYFLTSLVHASLLGGAIVMRANSIRKARDQLQWELEKAQMDIAHQQQWFQMLSHEVRTPLSIISSFAQLAQKNTQNMSALKNNLKQITGGVDRLSSVLSQLLPTERFTNRNLLQKESIEMVSLMRQLVQRTQKQTKEHVFNLNTHWPQCEFQGDQSLMTIAIQNILDNAIKYSAPGKIEVTIEHSTSSRFRISIKDQGMGISSDEITQIFERHYRGKNSAGVIGSGMGLYLVRAIIHQHGGSVSCESKLGKETTFKIELPYQQKDKV